MDTSNTGKEQPLKCEVIDGRIVISIGVEKLKFCHNDLEKDFEPRKGYGSGFLITDATGFAHDVVDEFLREEEDGTTVVIKLFEKAITDASNQGSIHTEERFDLFCKNCEKGIPKSEKGYSHKDGFYYCSKECAEDGE